MSTVDVSSCHPARSLLRFYGDVRPNARPEYYLTSDIIIMVTSHFAAEVWLNLWPKYSHKFYRDVRPNVRPEDGFSLY
jgi:hypothetical protein